MVLMGHWKKVQQARRLSKALQNASLSHNEAFVEAKKKAKKAKPFDKLCLKLTKWFKSSILKACCPGLMIARQKKWSSKARERIFISGTYENGVLKSCLGFVSGVFVTYLVFLFAIHHLKFGPTGITRFCIFVSPFITLGLAFSKAIRMIFLMILPQLFSSRGRAVLLAYVMLLALTGPARNSIHNTNVMAGSMLCGKNLIVSKTKEMIKSALSPLDAIKDMIKKVVETIKQFARRIKLAFLAMKKLFEEIADALKRFFGWIRKIPDICNEKMGQPYRSCMKGFDDAISDCRAKLGVFKFLCEIVTFIQPICNIVRIGELLCMIVSAIKTHIVDKLKNKLKGFVGDIKEMFYVRVDFIHHYNYTLEQSQSYMDVTKKVMQEIKDRMSVFNIFSNISSVLLILTLTLMFVQAWMYRKKYLVKDGHDNYYLTNHLYEIDEKRKEKGKETAFPLRFREKKRYVRTFSARMVSKEKRALCLGLVMVSITAIQAIYYIMLDYSLYWTLAMIRYYGEVQTAIEIPASVKVGVQGKGVMADMFRNIGTAFDPVSDVAPKVSTKDCLPNPNPPDYGVYKTIGIILFFCALLTLTQTYGKRLRHVVASWYFPHRERHRAVWLYNRILKSRGGFIRFMRRHLRKKTKAATYEKVSFKDRVVFACPALKKLLGFVGVKIERQMCLCCGQTGNMNDEINFKKCPNYGCTGVYCKECFEDLQNRCTLCMKPVDYGDLSDMSEEFDSSEEDEPVPPDPEVDVALLGDDGRSQRRQKIETEYEDIPPDKESDASSEGEAEMRPLKV